MNTCARSIILIDVVKKDKKMIKRERKRESDMFVENYLYY